MRVAALYDIHGNLPALEAVLVDLAAERVEAVVVGGDVVSGPFPAEALDLLSTVPGVRFVRGNADRDVLERVETHGGAWSADRLGDRRLALIASWPLVLELDVHGLGRVVFCHATPRSEEEIVTRISPPEDVLEAFAGVAGTAVVGHTHVQFDRSVGPLRLVNAGSVGMPYEGRRGAFWAVLGPDIELRRTVYDVGAAVARIRATGAPTSGVLSAWLLEPPEPEAATEHFEAQRGA